MTICFTAENTGVARSDGIGAGVAVAAGGRAAQVAIVSHEVGINRTTAWPRFVTLGIVNASSASTWTAEMTWLLGMGLRKRAECEARIGQKEQQVSRNAGYRRTDAAALPRSRRRTEGQPPVTDEVRTGAARAHWTSTVHPQHEALLPKDLAEGPHHHVQSGRITAAADAELAEATRQPYQTTRRGTALIIDMVATPIARPRMLPSLSGLTRLRGICVNWGAKKRGPV